MAMGGREEVTTGGMERQDFTLVKLFRHPCPGQDEFLLPFDVTNEMMTRNQMTLSRRRRASERAYSHGGA
jgi:hypothetical protein